MGANKMYAVNLPYACFGIITDDKDTIIETAPIASWMIGKHINKAKEWVLTKKGSIQKLDN